ncbi:unnamed protein product, partial [Ectocarpus sp. 13 AM-2016]
GRAVGASFGRSAAFCAKNRICLASGLVYAEQLGPAAAPCPAWSVVSAPRAAKTCTAKKQQQKGSF